MNPQVTLANWRSAPFNRWGFQHVRELIPSADIPNDARRVRELAVEKRNLDLRIEPDSGEALTLEGMPIHYRSQLFIDRQNELVIAKFSSQAMPLDAPRIGLTMRAVSQLRTLLADG